MDSQNITTSTFLPPPIDGEASAPLAQPDDDFVMSLSAAGTPNTPADDGGTGSTVSPVSPIHLNRQPHGTMMIDDDQPAVDAGVTEDSAGLLPPPDETESDDKTNKAATKNVDDGEGDDGNGDGKNDNDENGEDDDKVPVLAMSGMLPATATGAGGGSADTKKIAGGTDATNGGGTGNGDQKSKEK